MSEANYRTNTEILLHKIALDQDESKKALTTGAASNAKLVGKFDSGGRSTMADGAEAQMALTNSGHVIISDGGNAVTVDGTVTANLSAADNAVLDTIDERLDRSTAPTSTVMLTGVKAFTGPFYALSALEDSVIDASEGDTNITESDDSGSIQDLSGTLTIPKGMTIYGNFAVVELDSGKMLGYAASGVTVTVAS